MRAEVYQATPNPQTQLAHRPGRMKFSRQSRLLKPAEFKFVFQKPVRSGDDSFRVLARLNDKQQHRLGMAVSKKACARAVGRNRIKRVIRENFRNSMAPGCQNNPGEYSMDIVVMPTNLAASQTNKTLDESLSAHWQRLIMKAGDQGNGSRQDQIRTQA